VIQRNIFFETGDAETAEYLRIEVETITGGRLDLPEDIEESREQIRMFGLID